MKPQMKSWVPVLALVAGAVVSSPLAAQWVRTHEQFYLEAPHNWQFRDRYQAADRMFNAFDFGHAILYETLWRRPASSVRELEVTWYDRLTKEILVQPPRLPLEEGAIEIAYVKLAPEAKAMFEWAHILHRQLYDVLADERLDDVAKDREVARLIAYYKTRKDLAFSSRPKTMALMQEQPYSLAFRKGYPKFNGLIWAYHWLQIGLYEPLLVHTTSDARQAGVRATVARFWQMLAMAPMHMPYVMPMTPAVAPRFAERYPEAAIIFDNLHSMHDVVSDILANPSVPRDRKRAEILLAARRYRDDTSFVMSVDAWKTMSSHMGIENMGGPAVGFLPELPSPTVTYGAVMTHDDRTGAMTGFSYGSATGGAHAGHTPAAAAPADTTRPAADPHAGHDMRPAPADTGARRNSAAHHDTGHDMGRDSGSMELHMRMLSDPAIRRRILADSALHRLMMERVNAMPAEHREHMMQLMHPPEPQPSPVRTRPAATRATAPTTSTKAAATTKAAPTKTKAPPTKTKAPPTKTKAPDPHAGHRPPTP
ncbi:MAG TPA: hypothetical protein VFO66_01555 [Gemmatimonadaceae bacterium]|nr:hypothetical protein [Gemmatimonadaceae bacterium]